MTTQLLPDSLNITQFEQCLKSVNNFGSTTYMNICSGGQYVIPWGSADWALVMGLVILAVVGIAVFGTMFAVMIFDL